MQNLKCSHVYLALLVILVLKAVLGTVQVFETPLWQGHEEDYYNVIRFMAQEHTLPTEDNYPSANPSLGQATHPPLYPLLSSVIVALFDDGQPVPPESNPLLVCSGYRYPVQYAYAMTTHYNPPYTGTVLTAYLLRLFGLTLSIGAALFLFAAARVLFPDQPLLALLGSAFLTFEPSLFTLNGEITNENLLLLLTTANLYWAARVIKAEKLAWQDLLLVVITAVLAVATKINGYAVLGTTLVVIFARLLLLVRARRWRALLSNRAILIPLGILIGGLVVVSASNYLQTGNIFGRYRNIDRFLLNFTQFITGEDFYWTAHNTAQEYMGELPAFLQREKIRAAYLLTTLVSFAGFGVLLAKAMYKRDLREIQNGLLLLLYITLTISMVLLRSVMEGPANLNPSFVHTPIRYYLTAIPALMLALPLGWRALTPQLKFLSTRYGVAVAWGLGWFILAGITAVVLWQANPYRQFVLTAGDIPSNVVPVETDSQPADLPQLLAYSLQQAPNQISGTMYLTTQQALADSYVGLVILQDDDGASLVCEFIPGESALPTTRWEPGSVIAADLLIPNCGEPLDGPVDVSLNWQLANETEPVLAESLPIATFTDTLAQFPTGNTCLANLGRFGERLQVIQYNAPTEAVRGERYYPSVNWYVLAPVSDLDLHRVYHITHEESGIEYQCGGEPRLGYYPIRRWRRGEIVYFDECNFSFPEDSPLGRYTVSLTVIDEQGTLPVSVGSGALDADNALLVGRVELTP